MTARQQWMGLLAAAALAAACGRDEPLEGADSTGFIPNAAGANAPNNFDPSASPQGPDSTLGVVPPRTNEPGMAGDRAGSQIRRGVPVRTPGDTVRYGTP